jgi:hypothetical protein
MYEKNLPIFVSGRAAQKKEKEKLHKKEVWEQSNKNVFRYLQNLVTVVT